MLSLHTLFKQLPIEITYVIIMLKCPYVHTQYLKLRVAKLNGNVHHAIARHYMTQDKKCGSASTQVYRSKEMSSNTYSIHTLNTTEPDVLKQVLDFNLFLLD